MIVIAPPAWLAVRAEVEDIDVVARCLTVREAMDEGMFDTPKTEASVRQIPLSEAVLRLMMEWRARAKDTKPEVLVFATWSGNAISPNNVLRQQVYPACTTLGLRRVSWLTLRRTYSSWAHEKSVPGKVVAQLMGHAKVDTTIAGLTSRTLSLRLRIVSCARARFPLMLVLDKALG